MPIDIGIIRVSIKFMDNMTVSFDDISCVYCRNINSNPLYDTISVSGDKFTINKCIDCNCYFILPKPTEQQMASAYNENYFGKGERKFSYWIEKVLDLFRYQRARTVMRHVKAPANVLDIGCGNGLFLKFLIDHGYDGYGVELPSKSAERALNVHGLNLKIGRLCADDFESHFFDVITLWHVFEHLADPQNTLEIIDKIIKPMGYLMISMPNIDSFQSKLFKGKWLHLDPPRHLFFFPASDLIFILKQLGFELVTIKYFSLEQNPFGLQQSVLNCLFKKREVLFEVLKGNRLYAREYSNVSLLIQKMLYILTYPMFTLLSIVEACFNKGGAMELVFRKTSL